MVLPRSCDKLAHRGCAGDEMPKPELTGVDGREAPVRFAGLTYQRFREMALDPALSTHEKIGYPDGFRAGFEAAVLADVAGKLPALVRPGSTVLDIGAGCDELAHRLIAQTAKRQQTLVLVDSPEMLGQLPDRAHVHKLPGRFPDEVLPALQQALPSGADAIICYGVLQVVFAEANPFAFVDSAASLLAPGGRLLFGEVPNLSKLRRFLNSEAGRAYHKAYMRTEQAPQVDAFESPAHRIDDAVLAGLLLRLRGAGFDAWLLPQAAELPLSNRREDLLVGRP
jgi:SAM-dependent methyltransferase